MHTLRHMNTHTRSTDVQLHIRISKNNDATKARVNVKRCSKVNFLCKIPEKMAFY